MLMDKEEKENKSGSAAYNAFQRDRKLAANNAEK